MGIDQVAFRQAVFLDRDGTINQNVPNPATGCYEAPLTVADFVLAPGAMKALQKLQRAGYLLFLVSNQPNYAKGKSTLEDFAGIHTKFLAALEMYYVRFTAFYYCLHHPNGMVAGYSHRCDCRKPSPYFLHRAARDFNIRLEDSWMIGDRASDIECGHRAGVKTIRVMDGYTTVPLSHDAQPDFCTQSLADAVTILTSAPSRQTLRWSTHGEVAYAERRLL